MVAMTLPAKPWTHGMMTADGTRMFDSTVGSEGAWRATPIPAGGLPAGSIIQWGSNTAPANWLICDGSAVSRALWPSLFAVIGTTYGSGDGSTTFNLPDLRGRVAVGKNGGTFGTLGGVGGAETESHAHWTVLGNPSGTPYTHLTIADSTGAPAIRSKSSVNRRLIPEQSYLANTTTYESATYDATTSNLQPYLVTNYIIKATTGWSAGDSELALRMAAAETNASTTNKSGLVPVIPTSVVKDAGTVTVNANGKITFSGVTTLRLNGIFSGAFSNYRFFGDPVVTTTANNMNYRFCKDGVDYQTLNYMGWGWYLDYNSGGYDTGQSVINQNAGKFGYAYAGTGTMFFGDIIDPFIAAKPSAILSHQINGGTMWWRGNFYNNNVSADGITFIFPNAASGSFTFYGYKD